MQRKVSIVGLTAFLLASFTAPSIFAAKKKKPAEPVAAATPQLTPEEKVLHVLNRLTFGPRPGDVDAVKAMGVTKFIDQQLHPEDMPENPILETKLAPLDTLRMSTLEMVDRYPSNQNIKAIADGRQPYPTDPATQYMIARLVERYKARKDGDAAGKPEMDDNAGAMQPILASLTESQRNTMMNGTGPERVALLASLPEKQQFEILAAMKGPKRQQLFMASSPELRRKVEMLSGPQTVVNQDLFSAKIYRAVYSSRQLEEVLADFWYNHFNVYLDKGADKYLVTTYERDVIRPHVLGNFKDLLLATAQSPAMLFYLDNNQSVGPDAPANRMAAPKKGKRGLNENYGRELMELHTLGVDGGYTQKDVTEVARCFTGWTIRDARGGASFQFNERAHDQGEKLVLGHKIAANGGMNDGLEVIDILAHHPATARFISRSLAIRFVSDNPSPALIDSMAATFTSTNGDLRAVMKTMFDSPDFWAPANYRAKVKTPFEMVVSSLRATGGDVDITVALTQQLNQLGEPLYRKQEPTGYSNKSGDWVNSAALLARMNFALALTNNKVPGVKVDLAKFAADRPHADGAHSTHDGSIGLLAQSDSGRDSRISPAKPRPRPWSQA